RRLRRGRCSSGLTSVYGPPISWGTDMASFSGGASLMAGFRLLRQRPGLLAPWALAWLLVGLAPQILPYAVLWPDVVAAYGPMFHDAVAGIEPDQQSAELMTLQNRMLPFSLLQLPLSLAGLSILYAAVYRAVLEPKAKGFGYLRLGRAELWMMLTQAAALGLFVLASIAALIVGAIAVLAIRIASGNDDGVTGIATFGACLIAAILLGWCAVRLSLALPMTFTERRFRLLESWALTRGHGWKIFGVMVGLVAILLLMEVALVMVVMIVAVAAGVSGGLTGLEAQLQGLFSHPPAVWLPVLGPWLAVGTVVYAVMAAALHAITVAPLAEIYRQLAGKPAAEV
ncbi:hypothetical protein, partial [Phenylobacterium aquaticum]